MDEVLREGFCGKVIHEQHLNEASEKVTQISGERPSQAEGTVRAEAVKL